MAVLDKDCCAEVNRLNVIGVTLGFLTVILLGISGK